MNKPITVARQDFAEGLVELINNSELPAFVMTEILKSCMGELAILSQKQYEAEKAEWEKSQKDTVEE